MMMWHLHTLITHVRGITAEVAAAPQARPNQR